MAVWPLVSSDALSRHFLLYFCLLMCRRPLQLWGFGYSLTDRLVHLSLEHDLQPFTIRHVVVSPHPSLPGPDWRCLWYGSFNIQRYMWEYILLLTFINIVDSGPRFARGVLWCMGMHFNFHRVLSVVAIRIIGACLSTSSRRLLLRYWATPVGSSPVTSTSFTTVL